MTTGSDLLERVAWRHHAVAGASTPLPTLVVIPTYDEAGTIASLLRGVRRALPRADILVVDDNSPDGTAAIVEALGGELGRIMVLHRPVKEGLGTAYRAGFAFGLTHRYDLMVQMDADLSHDPRALPALVRAVEHGADLAIGSRYVPGAAIPEWTRRRRALSRGGNRYAGAVLGVDVHDLTSGYRAMRADTLRTIEAATTRSTGYAFQIELAYRVATAGGTIVEVPIEFNDRVVGDSKMSSRITVEALARVTWWGLRDRCRVHPVG
jgi:dolichol-phosphate mannosyltransferase